MPWRRERLPTPVFWPGQFCGVAKSQTRVSDFHFTLLSVMISSSIHVVANGISSFFLNGWVIFHLIYIYIYIYACMLSCFSLVPLFVTMDCNPPGSSVHGILQEGILKWIAMPSWNTHTHIHMRVCAHTRIPHLLYSVICWWTFRLSPCLDYYK